MSAAEKDSPRRFLRVCPTDVNRSFLLIVLILHPHSTTLYFANQRHLLWCFLLNSLQNSLICKALHSVLRRLLSPDFSAAVPEMMLFPPLSLRQKKRRIFPFQRGWFHAPYRAPEKRKDFQGVPPELFAAQDLLPKSEGVCVYDGGEKPENYRKTKIRQGISLLPQGCVLPYFCNNK